MTHVLTLIAAEPQSLSEMFARSIAQALGGAAPVWLEAHRACDISCATPPDPQTLARVAALCAAERIDHVLQPAEHRRKRLLVADMDSTMITVECIDELADFVGKKAQVAEITERAMRGELDFAAALAERVALLKGLPEASLQRCYDERVRMMPGAKQLISTMRASGAYCVLVSGGFSFFTSRVAAELGFHEDHSNTLEIENGMLTGRVVPPILGKEAKLATLQRIAREKNIPLAESIAIGDGANDLPMLLAAGLGVAYHAKPVVREQANARIDFGDLSALVYAQGMVPA